MVKCSFCSEEVKQSRDYIFVEASGKANHFCCRKCKSNFRLKRDPRRVNWIRKKKAEEKK